MNITQAGILSQIPDDAEKLPRKDEDDMSDVFELSDGSQIRVLREKKWSDTTVRTKAIIWCDPQGRYHRTDAPAFYGFKDSKLFTVQYWTHGNIVSVE